MTQTVFAFHPSLRPYLSTVKSAHYAIRLVRYLVNTLSLEEVEIQIIIGILACEPDVLFDDVCDILPHFDVDRVKRLLNRMVRCGTLIARSCDDDHGFCYSVHFSIENQIAAVTLENLG